MTHRFSLCVTQIPAPIVAISCSREKAQSCAGDEARHLSSYLSAAQKLMHWPGKRALCQRICTKNVHPRSELDFENIQWLYDQDITMYWKAMYIPKGTELFQQKLVKN
jgi:hypothetical protein